jgi:S-adenosylmethionine:tRNA ribosyltransferase-isomerase
MKTSDFDFFLPDELIARYPLPERGASRLLHVDGKAGSIQDRFFAELPEFFRPGDLLIFNDTRVIKARLRGKKPTGGKVEGLVERVLSEHEALLFMRASKSLRPGMMLRFAGCLDALVLDRQDDLFRMAFDPAHTVLEWLERCGEVPLPPYMERAPELADDDRYQTVYARDPGAVAAPTAGLHFDEAMLARLVAAGVETAFVTLHVGAGTFLPVRAEAVADHKMHTERYVIPPQTVAAVAAARSRGGRICAVGTTSLRALESAALKESPGRHRAAAPRGGQGNVGRPDVSLCGDLQAGEGETDIFITPGYRFRVVDRMVTNFHLPKSTLLMLVSAFGGTELLLHAYAHAVASGYRFFSYGDAMFIERAE